MVVIGIDLGGVASVGHLEDVLPAIRVVLVRAEQAKVLAVEVVLHHVAKEYALHASGLGDGCSRARHVDRVIVEVGQPEILQQQTAVRVRAGAHPEVALWAPVRRALA